MPGLIFGRPGFLFLNLARTVYCACDPRAQQYYYLHYKRTVMSSISMLALVLLAIAAFCFVFRLLHQNLNKRQANVLNTRLEKAAGENKLVLSLKEQIKDAVLGFDAGNNKLIVCKWESELIIDLADLKECRKQKKWIHIPAEKGRRSETHLEKIALLFEFKSEELPAELIFYEYKHNSIFQMQELEQKANKWELLLNKKTPIPAG